MNKKRFFSFIAIALVSSLVVVCMGFISPSVLVAQSNRNLLISAAASTQDVMKEIKPLYEKSKSVKITYNFGSSGALQQQIEQGAPVDVFISAAKKQMDALEQKGLLLPGSRSNLANNRLVLIVPKNSNLGITSFYKLPDAKVKKIAIGETRSVPAGQYGEQVLKKLGVWDKVKNKLVLAKNVRQVLAVVESGNADAGLVYATDAKLSNNVKVVVAADEKYHSPIIYPMAAIKRSKNPAIAQDFLKFLSSNQAKTILKKYGFIVS